MHEWIVIPGMPGNDAPEPSSEPSELGSDASELSSEASEASSGTSELSYEASELSYEASELSHEAPELSSEKHGFVPCMCENSENYRGIWTTNIAPWGGHVARVYVFQRKSMVLYPPGTKIMDFAMANGPQRGAASQSYLG